MTAYMDLRCAMDILDNVSGACRDIDAKQFIHGARLSVRIALDDALRRCEREGVQLPKYERPGYIWSAIARSSASPDVAWRDVYEGSHG